MFYQISIGSRWYSIQSIHSDILLFAGATCAQQEKHVAPAELGE